MRHTTVCSTSNDVGKDVEKKHDDTEPTVELPVWRLQLLLQITPQSPTGEVVARGAEDGTDGNEVDVKGLDEEEEQLEVPLLTPGDPGTTPFEATKERSESSKCCETTGVS